MKLFGLPILAYIIGSIPWGLVLTKLFTSVDIRQSGSGNIGAANVRRLAGTPLGVITLIGDMSKGALPVWLAMQIIGPDVSWRAAYLTLIALCAFLGHLYPLFLGCRPSGKGVATAAGCYLVMEPWAFPAALLAYIVAVCLSSRSSVGSLSAAAVLPVALWTASHSTAITIGAVIISTMVFLRHSDNIKRLFKGQEPKL